MIHMKFYLTFIFKHAFVLLRFEETLPSVTKCTEHEY